MNSNRWTTLLLGVALPVTSLLSGCSYSSKTATEPVAVTPSPTVVVAPATPSHNVAVVPAAPAPLPRVVTYPEGRFQLYGDAATGYYWVWVPTGTTAPAPPVPPLPPRLSRSPSTSVVVAPAQNEIIYRDGRYQLYGDAATGYYWVWIPNGIVLPYAPPPLGRLSRAQAP